MNNSLCTKLWQIVSIYAKTVSKCAIMWQTVHNCAKKINRILFLMTENYLCQTIPKHSEVCKTVRNCAQLCTTVSEIKLYLFSIAENDLCPTVQNVNFKEIITIFCSYHTTKKTILWNRKILNIKYLKK